jgi:prevent-host-death family protein
MSTTRLTSREFNQDLARAKRAALAGPVVITDRGRPAFVLQRYEDWRQQTNQAPPLTLLDALADTDGADIVFEPEALAGPLSKTVDLD